MPNYIYKFLNYDDEVIYIGKTGNIKHRLKQHFGPNAHLPKECYEQVKQIFFANVESKFNAEFLETFLINKFHPIYNTDKKYREEKADISVPLEEPEWKEILFLKTKTKNNLPGIEFLTKYPPYIDRRLMHNESIKMALDFNIKKVTCYQYEFKKYCPMFMNLINNNFKELRELLSYIDDNINIDECNVDEYVTATVQQQLDGNYLAFNLGEIKKIAKIIPDFHLLLKYEFIKPITKNIFILPIITPNFLSKIEDNILGEN